VVLPDRKLMDIMTISYERKDASVKCATAVTGAPEASPKGMVIVSNYRILEKPEKGVFC
jgi:hypothetical protein